MQDCNCNELDHRLKSKYEILLGESWKNLGLSGQMFHLKFCRWIWEADWVNFEIILEDHMRQWWWRRSVSWQIELSKFNFYRTLSVSGSTNDLRKVTWVWTYLLEASLLSVISSTIRTIFEYKKPLIIIYASKTCRFSGF